MKLEVGEYYLSAGGEIIKIVNYDKYGFRFEDENVNYYKEDGVIYGDAREFDLIAHIPKDLHLYLLQSINDYYIDEDFKETVKNIYKD